MASFTVILDGQTLANEPMGLQDTAISIQRNEDLPGLFTTMVSDLEFWGDGYEILYAYYQANDLCKEVSCQIIEDCNDGLNFRGLIYLSDVEFQLLQVHCDLLGGGRYRSREIDSDEGLACSNQLSKPADH
jgi:hypothetical protein